jgi:hypothetical protein
MFTNINIALMDDAELASGDISVFGIELNLFVPTYAEDTTTGGGGTGNQYIQCASIGCSYLGNEYCGKVSVYNSNGTITTYWCVIYVVHGGCDPPIYC